MTLIGFWAGCTNTLVTFVKAGVFAVAVNTILKGDLTMMFDRELQNFQRSAE